MYEDGHGEEAVQIIRYGDGFLQRGIPTRGGDAGGHLGVKLVFAGKQA